MPAGDYTEIVERRNNPGDVSLPRNEGGPYLARFWRDVGRDCSRSGKSQAQPALLGQHLLIPTSSQNRARYGAPSFRDDENVPPAAKARSYVWIDTVFGDVRYVTTTVAVASLEAAILLSIAALLAGWAPARKASRIQPIQALRHE
jgi:hypothetical protein